MSVLTTPNTPNLVAFTMGMVPFHLLIVPVFGFFVTWHHIARPFPWA